MLSFFHHIHYLFFRKIETYRQKLLETLIFVFLISAIFATNCVGVERTEKEKKLGVFKEDLKTIGNFKEIEKFPKELFSENLKTFFSQSKKAQKEVKKIFVDQKGLLDKYPQRMMIGMAYFEFFYMMQLKDHKRDLEKFVDKYPNRGKKVMQKLYNLNQARTTMREAVGLTIEDSPEVAVSSFYTMYKLFDQAKTQEYKLSKEEKKKIKLHKDINKQLTKTRKTLEKYQQQRLVKKKFTKENKKNYKKLQRSLKKAEIFKEYELLSSLIVELPDLTNKNISAAISCLRLADFILKDIKTNILPKRFKQDLTDANFSNFNQDELIILGELTKFTKKNKNIKSNKIQLDILNLENNGLPVNKLLDLYRNDLDVKLEALNLQLASSEQMSKWALSDWANAWKNPIPIKVKDSSGIEVTLSDDQITEIKAQLAMQNFREILDIEDFKNVIGSDSFNDITQTVSQITESFNFDFTLDDFARAMGDLRGIDLNNYADLTDLANAQYGANWSVEEYASAYQDNLNAIEALASGTISSFDVGALAQAAGASLQEVADTIAAASAAGVSVDLEAVAAGAGYDSFAAAVEAYNAANGTNYSVEEAKEALGQN